MRDELSRCRGEQFDPELTDAFLEVLDELAERRATAARIAAEAAARIDPGLHETLLTLEDEATPAYAEIAAILREVRDANPPTRYLTTQARFDRRYVTVVDAEEQGPDLPRSAPDIFPDEVLQVLPRVLAGDDPKVNALFADQYGVWVTGLAPIRNHVGETIAVVAADLPPFRGAEEGGLRTAGEASLASILQAAAITSSRDEVDSISDGLTGLYNHRYLHERLTEELERAAELDSQLSVLFCDLDRFAEFNEQLGHRAGDNALRAVAHVLEQSIRAVDLAARYGGEEFVVVLLETDSRGRVRRGSAHPAGHRGHLDRPEPRSALDQHRRGHVPRRRRPQGRADRQGRLGDARRQTPGSQPRACLFGPGAHEQTSGTTT